MKTILNYFGKLFKKEEPPKPASVATQRPSTAIPSTPYQWDESKMLEISLNDPGNFLKIKETLTRIGITNNKAKKLYQSCHILHKQNRYYLLHFKELFALNNQEPTLSVEDIERRNTIAKLLEEWGLLTILHPEQIEYIAPISKVRIIPYREKHKWTLIPKFSIGRRDHHQNQE